MRGKLEYQIVEDVMQTGEIPVEQKAVLIVNTRSRRGREWLPRVEAALKDSSIRVCETWALRHPKAIMEKTQAAVASQTPLVIVGGGDGTLSSVARYFIGSCSTLGVIPMGTGNQFARDLGIVAEVEAACEVLANGKRTLVDVGIIGDHTFLNVATVGLTTRIAEELTVEAKRRFGRFVYVIALAHALQRVKPFRATIQTKETSQTFETLQIVIGNGRFHAGPFPLAPEARITSGRLVAYALKTTSRWELIRFGLNLPGGHHVELEDVTVLCTRGGRLVTSPPQKITVDGEIALRTPVDFGIKPLALPVMTPQEFAG